MFARTLIVLALLFPVAALAEPLDITDNVLVEEVPGTHVVSVTVADGDTFTVHNAIDATVDGKPILLAQADTTLRTQDAGSASALGGSGLTQPPSGPESVAPADKLADPIAQPRQAWDDLRAAKKDGWVIAFFAGLLMLAKVAGRLGRDTKWLAFLGRGKAALAVSAAGALAAGCYNAAAEGGAWSAVLIAGAVALFGALDLGEKKSAQA